MNNNPNDHTIVVTGATGQQGGAVARHLLKRGFRVRALTRNPSQDAARKLADQGAEIVRGNFEYRDSLDVALKSVYGAFSVQTFDNGGVEAETRRGKSFADAAKDAEVEHFVYSSVIGAELETGVPHFESKWKIEEHISNINLPATILRPVFFMNNWKAQLGEAIQHGSIPLPLSPDTSLEQIAVADIGALATLAFTNPDKWIGRAINIAGDELTMTETAEIFRKVLDREVTYSQVPWQTYQEQVSEFLGDELGEELTDMYRWFEEEEYYSDIDKLREVHPNLKSLEQFLQRQDWV